MKQVFSSHSQVCHAFNLQNQIRGRAGNIFFESNKIYSYGYHYLLGEFISADTILINNKGYSNSTSKHINILQDATRNRHQIFTTNIDLDYVLNTMERLYKSLMKARKPQGYFESILSTYRRFHALVDRLNGFYIENRSYRGFQFVRLYERDDIQDEKMNRIDELHSKAMNYSDTDLYKKKVERAEQLEAIKAEKEREAREARAKELERTKAERIERFYNYEANRVSSLRFDLLRLSKCGEYVETSQAVRIPKKEAQRYFRLFQKGLDLRGLKIGEFTTLSNSLGLLKIGCHQITHDEVNRIGNLLNA